MHNRMVFHSKKIINLTMANNDKVIPYNDGHLYHIQLLKMVQERVNQSRSMEQNREPQK